MTFQVVFTGMPRDGFSRRQAIASLAKRFGLDFEQLKRLLAGNPKVVKCVGDRGRAETLIRTLWQLGWHAELRVDGRVISRTGGGPAQRSVAEVAGTMRVVAENGDITVEIPRSWQICEGLNVQAVLQAGNVEADHYLIVLRQARRDLPVALDLVDYFAAQLQQCVAKVVDGTVLQAPVPMDHKRGPAYIAEMSAQLDGVSVRYLVAGLQCKSGFYTLFLWCNESEFSRERARFLHTVGSFRVAAAEAGKPLQGDDSVCLEQVLEPTL